MIQRVATFSAPLMVMLLGLFASHMPAQTTTAQATTRPAPTSRVYPPIPANPPVTTLSPIATGLQWIGPAVSEPDYYVWCTSPIADDDGKIHLYVSRWPRQYKMNGWRTHGEIAHYVADKPEGPFTFHDIAIPSNPDALWNNSIHNPAIVRVGDTYYLFYISFDRNPSDLLAEGRMPNWVGLAKSSSPYGPWTVLTKDHPLFKPSTDPAHFTHGDWQCTNPTFLAFNGKYYLFYRGGKRLPGRPSYPYTYAIADHPEGPYHIADRRCIDPNEKIEDATAFLWQGKVRLLTTDNFGVHTGLPGAGILWTAPDPTHFRIQDAQIGYLNSDKYAQGKFDPAQVKRYYGRDYKFERPGILMLNGKPAYFYASSGFNLSGGPAPESYVLKINLSE